MVFISESFLISTVYIELFVMIRIIYL